MAHVTSGKVKTNMFLIWYGPDGEDTCDNFELTDNEMHDIDYIMELFKLYWNQFVTFMQPDISSIKCPKERMRWWNTFYHHIQKLCVQCQFSDDEEHLVDAIIYGTKVQKPRGKLLQMPTTLLCMTA